MAGLDDDHAVTITVGGADVTPYLLDDTLRIVDALTQEVDTAEFTLEDIDGACAPGVWDEVIITDEAGTKHFGGYLTDLTEVTHEAAAKRYMCRCEDYSALCKTVAVNASYASQTDAAIVAALFAGLAASDGFDAATHVGSSGTVDHILFNRVGLLDAMQQLCERTGWDWYIDADKAVWYFDPAVGSAAPFGLSDTPDYSATYPYDADGIELQSDGVDIRNRVYVYGGAYEAPATIQSWTGDGVTQEFWLAYKPKTIHTISVDGAAQSFGVDFVDDPNAYDCLVNYQEKALRFYAAAPAAGAVIACTYTYEIPIAVMRSDAASHTAYGRWFDYTLVDRKIASIASAQAAADAILAQHAFAQAKARNLSTHRLGLRSGQRVEVTCALLGLSAAEYLIQRVTKTVKAGYIVCGLELGEYDASLTNWMAKLARQQHDDLEPREAETLRVIISLDTDTAEVTESVAATLQTAGDYYWSDEVLGDPAGKQVMLWGAFTWGSA